MDLENIKNNFSNHFQAISNFDDIKQFSTAEAIGFSLKKYHAPNNKITMMSCYFYLNDNDDIKKLIINVYYGDESEDKDGVRIRESFKINEPIDFSVDGYCYDIVKNEFFEKNKNKIEPITLSEIIRKVYQKHTITTKKIKGFFVRIKLFFWRVAMVKLFKFFTSILSSLLFLITGDRYSFDPFWETRKLNGKIISSRLMKEPVKIEKSEELKFFDYTCRYWTIIFYSFLHLSISIIFFYSSTPPVFVYISKSTFLGLCYIMFSLWIVDRVLPWLFKKGIEETSRIVTKFLTRAIKV